MQSSFDSHFDVEGDARRYGALLDVADLMVHHGSLPELFRELANRLHRVTEFEVASFCLHDPRKNVMQLHIWEGGDHSVRPAEVPIEKSPSGWVLRNQEILVVPDLEQETRFAEAFQIMSRLGIRSYCVVPLTTLRRQLGALGLGSSQVDAYGESDQRLLSGVAELVALAVENALTREALREEKDRLHALLEINGTLVSHLDLEGMLPAISESLRRVLPVDYTSISLDEKGTGSLHTYPLNGAVSGSETTDTVSQAESLAELALRTGEVQLMTRLDSESAKSAEAGKLLDPGIQSGCYIPLITPKGRIGTLNLASKAENAFNSQNLDLLKQVASQMAAALENARAYEEIRELKERLAQEKLYLEEEIRSNVNFEEIVGESLVLKRVLAQARTVASSEATVLILGETGTGKELIARAIHRMSPRKDNSFIKVNCAAIPTGLLESELFGHEKGAFTGAISRKIGRIELADKGTLLLDEIGDISLELQPKLLRVLQDQEFERLGSTRTLHVDVRVIAATNRNLSQGVADREFRSDLFYRLNVFPLHIPPLRERRKDIPQLVRYFVQKFARRMDRKIETIPTETMNALVSWEWPGNVRELENFIERSVILSEGPALRAPLAELGPVQGPSSTVEATLEKVEREHIIRILRETGGVVAGPRGAAARLGMKRTTLQSRMRKMGIVRSDYAG
jgi:formate hydrogenlyase transcriptional activator